MENTITKTPKERANELHTRIKANAAVATQTILSIGRDLKIMRDEKLYIELGYTDFGVYCDKKAEVKKRQAYNFIKCYEKYGDRLNELSGIGVTKLTLMTALDDEDREELIESGDAAALSTRELEKRIEELKNKYEQLTLQYDEAKTEAESNESTLEDYRKQIDKLSEELKNAETRNKELENRPVEVAVQQPSDEEIKKIKDEAMKSAQKAAQKAADANEKQHKEELEKLRTDLQKQYEQVSKENAEQSKQEIERLKSENAILQANAKKQQKAPDEAKARVKFYLAEMQNTFNSAAETVRSVEDEEQKAKYLQAFKAVLTQMAEIVERI